MSLFRDSPFFHVMTNGMRFDVQDRHYGKQAGKRHELPDCLYDDDVFIKHSDLPGEGTLCGYEYKTHTDVDKCPAVAGSRGIVYLLCNLAF